jgi:hypothetical protein
VKESWIEIHTIIFEETIELFLFEMTHAYFLEVVEKMRLA